MTAARLAQRLDISHPSVLNWHKEGMPCAHIDEKGRRWYEPEACEAWARTHKRWKAHGGKRRGAGRPRKRDGPTTESVQMAERFRAAERLREISERERPPSEALRADALANITLAELRYLAAIYDDVSTPSNYERERALIDLRAKVRAERIAEGELVEAAEVERVWTETLRQIRAALERVPAELVPAIVSLTGSPPELAHAIRAEIERAVRRAMAEAAA